MSSRLVNRGVPPAVDVALRFGPFHLDLCGSRLLRGTAVIPLRPKTWSVLLYLVERPGALVTKDELFDALWPDTAVTPDTLNKSIGELRAALGDDSHVPRFIETVTRRGFRFIAATDATVDPAPAAPPLIVEQRKPSLRPFVGRQEELQFLAERFARAQAGERQIVFVTGSTGVGKTALIEAFLASAAVSDMRSPVWIGRAGCFEHHGPGEAYLSVLQALEQLARPPRVERLVKLMRRAAPMWLAQMPWLIDETEAVALREALHGVRAERMPRELAHLIEELTAELTLVLVLEDLHWSDPSTVDLITLLAQRSEPARLLVIGTYRPAEVAVREHALLSAVRALQAQQRCVELPLHDLTAAGVRSYLTTRFPGSDFPPALAELIHSHSGGHPLFVVAIVDHMLSRGWILDTAPGWALTTPPEAIDLGVPDDVRLMIETQLQRASPGDRSLLEAASVAGNEITAMVLAAALGCAVDAAEQRCEGLARVQQFMRVAGTIEWPDGHVGRRYAFMHEIYRQVVYEEIPPARCAALHQRIGEALETAYGERAAEIAPQLAVHFRRSRDTVRAVRHLIAAGVRARNRFGVREAIGYLEEALARLPLLADQSKRRRWELQVRLALGRARGDIAFTTESVRENYERVTELSAALGSAPELFEALYARWYLHLVRGDRHEALALAQELSEVSRRTGSLDDGVTADSALVRTAFGDGRFSDVRRHMQSLLARRPDAPGATVTTGYGVHPLFAATTHYAAALWFLGDLEGARTAARSALDRARQSGNPFFSAAIGSHIALIELLFRNSAAASALAAEAAALAAEQGFAFWNALATALSGFAQVQQGRATAGVAQLTAALDSLRATGTRFFTAYVHAFLAEGCLRLGTVTSGLAVSDAGIMVTETTLDRGYAPELWRLKGELLLASAPAPPRPRGGRSRTDAADANWPEAEVCLTRALELSRAAEARSLELRAATSLACAWGARGRLDESRAVLGAICDWFGNGPAIPDLVEARALLGELATARPRGRPT
jgi:DNA-binding winged helix-turn-helix (wHTH) protein/tetratricopeptide (TPR) repeat protein